MGKRKNDSLGRRTGTRKYNPVCWISSEGQTEKDYFALDAIRKHSRFSVKHPQDIHPDRRNPRAVLKRFQKALRNEDFRAIDEAWIVVDVDEWDSDELGSLFTWASQDNRCHVAISNPKFELYLVMHFEKGNGCTTAPKVDAAIRRRMPGYDKRLKPGQFSEDQIRMAMENARAKRRGHREDIPAPGMTDVYQLVESLIGGNE